MLPLLKSLIAPLLDPIYGPLPLRCHLRETRVFLLEKGDWEDAISCRLEIVSLGTKPVYEALSYAWGPSSELRSILVNGHPVPVRANLESALRQLRSTTYDRALWADAICINQRDVQERNGQVALMRDIYSQCKGVIIWLGYCARPSANRMEPTSACTWETDFEDWRDSSTAHSEDSKRISKFIEKVEHYYRLPFALRQSHKIDTVMGAYCLISQLAQNKHVDGGEIPLLSNHDAFHRIIGTLHELMSQTWWSRQWVVQEIVLPPQATLYFGNCVAPWGMFARAARNYDRHRKACCDSHYTCLPGNDIRHLEHFSRTVAELDDLRQEWQRILKRTDGSWAHINISLRQLLWQFRQRDTSDPKDKVFALFPLVNYWGKQIAMHPEYGWSSQAIYRATTEKIMAVDDSLLVLMGSTEKRLPGLPTWVPDWTCKPTKYELERLERTQLFNASRSMKPAVRFMGECFMELKGVHFDTVTATSECMRYNDEDETLEIFASWYDFVCAEGPLRSNYIGGGSRMEAYWRTLCIDTDRGIDKDEDMGQRYRRCSQKYVDHCCMAWMDSECLPHASGKAEMPSTNRVSNGGHKTLNGASCTLQTPTEANGGKKLSYVAVDFAITSATSERKLFFTKNGYIGLGPPKMEVGDQVYVFSGGHMPFVVRRDGMGDVPAVGLQECYQLVGDCYVHGIMDGEAMQDYATKREEVYLL